MGTKPHQREHYRKRRYRIPMILKPIAHALISSWMKCLKVMRMVRIRRRRSWNDGYSLMCTVHFEKFIMLVGSGSNGKSVILELLEAVLGNHNVCAVQLAKLSSTFQRAYLHTAGQSCNGDCGRCAGRRCGIEGLYPVKTQPLRRRTKTRLARPYSTCWFGTNHMPHTRLLRRLFSGRLLCLSITSFRKALMPIRP